MSQAGVNAIGSIPFIDKLSGTGTSVNAAPVDLITFSLDSSVSVYRFFIHICGRDTGTGDGVGYSIFASARTDGATCTIISSPFNDNDEDTSLVAATATITSSGNDFILRVAGVAGQTVTYRAVGTYISI